MDFIRNLKSVLVEKLQHYPIVAILGPRQVGKTTLAKEMIDEFDKEVIYLDLESPSDFRKLDDAERYFQEREDKLIIIDEIQRNASLFPILRSIIDQKRIVGRFILLGSASPILLAKSSETLAGRIFFMEMQSLLWEEVRGKITIQELWLKGGFPDFLMTKDNEISLEKRNQFIQSYIERDLPLLGLNASPIFLRNLIVMLSHLHGNLLNLSFISKSIGKDINTIKNVLDYLENAYIIRKLLPYHFNIPKRIVKSPKIYFRDSGLIHALLDIENMEDLEGHPQKGNSWEGFVINQIIAKLKNGVSPYFYRTQDGTELDLLLVKGIKPVLGIEIKYSNSPTISRGTIIASQDFNNIPVFIITPSVSDTYSINEFIQVCSFEHIFKELKKLKLTNH